MDANLRSLLLLFFCMANIDAVTLALPKFDETLIEKKLNSVKKVAFFKKITQYSFVPLSSIVIGYAVYSFFLKDNNLNNNDVVSSKHSSNIPVKVNEDIKVVQPQLQTSTAQVSPSVKSSSFVERGWKALKKGSKSTLSLIPKFMIEVALMPVARFFSEKVFGPVDLKWAVMTSNYALRLKNIKQSAYNVDPNVAIDFDGKDKLDKTVSPDLNQNYLESLIINFNSYIDSIALILAVMKYDLETSKPKQVSVSVERFQKLFDSIKQITEKFCFYLDQQVVANDHNGLFGHVIAYLNLVELNINSYLAIEKHE